MRCYLCVVNLEVSRLYLATAQPYQHCPLLYAVLYIYIVDLYKCCPQNMHTKILSRSNCIEEKRNISQRIIPFIGNVRAYFPQFSSVQRCYATEKEVRDFHAS